MSRYYTITPDQAGWHEIRALKQYATDNRGRCEMTGFLLTIVEMLEDGKPVVIRADDPARARCVWCDKEVPAEPGRDHYCGFIPTRREGSDQ